MSNWAVVRSLKDKTPLAVFGPSEADFNRAASHALQLRREGTNCILDLRDPIVKERNMSTDINEYMKEAQSGGERTFRLPDFLGAEVYFVTEIGNECGDSWFRVVLSDASVEEDTSLPFLLGKIKERSS